MKKTKLVLFIVAAVVLISVAAGTVYLFATRCRTVEHKVVSSSQTSSAAGCCANPF